MIFHEYDIRGKYPSEINEKKVYEIGRAYVLLFKPKKVVIGADTRLSSPSLKRALIRGITDQGCHVIDAGLCSTPMVYYISRYEDAIMITASHNPKEYNGLKIARKGCRVMGKFNGLDRLRKKVEKGKLEKTRRKGKVKRKDYKKEYVDFVLSFKKGERELKIVVDAGNGMAGLFAPRVLRHFPVRLIPMYFRLDGHFSHHVPNPVDDKNVKMLQKRVKKMKADLGIAYDGDADRVRFIDDKGRAIRADITLALLSTYFKKPKVVKDVTCSRVVEDTLRRKGKVVVSRVGHTNIKMTMSREKAVLGGERSGHYYFKKNKYCDNAMIATVVMLNILSETGMMLSDLIQPYLKYHSKQVNLRVKDANAAIIKVKKKYSSKRKSLLDGLTVHDKKWWFNIRASHTEPVLRLTVEAENHGLLLKKIGILRRLVK